MPLISRQKNLEYVNFNKEQEALIEQYRKEGKRPTILIHSCCAPCSTYVIEKLVEDVDVTIYFYNPNIHPKIEYQRREQAQKDFIDAFNAKEGAQVQFLAERYQPKEFFEVTKDFKDEKEGGERCNYCFELRLGEAAKKAKELNFDMFASALTLSPKKNSLKINELGLEIEEELGIAYLPSDFKKKNGYKRSIEICADYDVYRQCYCGCVFAAKDQGIDFKEIIENARKELKKRAEKVPNVDTHDIM